MSPKRASFRPTLHATDADAGDSLTYSIVGGPAHGTLSGSGASRTYTPAAGYSGPDSFTFKANDGQVDSNTATVSITVKPVVVTTQHKAYGSGKVRATSKSPYYCFTFNVKKSGSTMTGSASVTTSKGSFSGSTVTSMTVSGHVAVFKVTGKYKGTSGYTLTVTATDGSPDKVKLVLKKGSTTVYSVYGTVSHGSLTVL
jgi:Big-like domain-containing protein